MIINKVTQEKGFTLIEMIIYIGIFSLLIGVLSAIFGAILDVQLESEGTSKVDQNGRYILAKLNHDIEDATAITTPSSPGQTTSTLQITVNSIIYTYGLDGSGNLQLTTPTGTNNLNSQGITVSGLSFTRLGNGGANDTIRVNYTITSTIQSPSGPESRTFQTTLGSL
ncbi:MAG: prepilin-type N-terminal cleavage/methylation domain-containing protein [Candidatus Levybacteria bacterium]|nr:prepilin-type N-terminal cleavage/methylation domain-containing protein [Candidatus Levybacteria bacterium]